MNHKGYHRQEEEPSSVNGFSIVNFIPDLSAQEYPEEKRRVESKLYGIFAKDDRDAADSDV